MDYKRSVLNILRELEMGRIYSGNEYVANCVQYIAEHEDNYAPITKILYVEVAKQVNSSHNCVEKGIRNVIRAIWDYKGEEQVLLIKEIFGQYSEEHKPSNSQFLLSLYDYIKYRMPDAGEHFAHEECCCAHKREHCKYYQAWIKGNKIDVKKNDDFGGQCITGSGD